MFVSKWFLVLRLILYELPFRPHWTLSLRFKICLVEMKTQKLNLVSNSNFVFNNFSHNSQLIILYFLYSVVITHIFGFDSNQRFCFESLTFARSDCWSNERNRVEQRDESEFKKTWWLEYSLQFHSIKLIFSAVFPMSTVQCTEHLFHPFIRKQISTSKMMKRGKYCNEIDEILRYFNV